MIVTSVKIEIKSIGNTITQIQKFIMKKKYV